MPTILIADDHPLFREALRGAVVRDLPAADIVEAETAEGLFAAADEHPHADLVLMDLGMPGAHGFSALVHLRAAQPQLPVIVVSAREEPATIRRAIDHGAAGFIPKSADTASIHAAIGAVLDGDTWIPPQSASASGVGREEAEIAQRIRELSPQQFRVLSMLGAGLLNKQIAYAMDVSEATVKAHMTAVLRKLGASNRTQAVLLAGRLSLDGSVSAGDEAVDDP
ncbi:response regulator transcription factor [Coralloluteibacterium stylophorae]|uniref:Response regulator transcription factor n=1 Tax=Coralloluteibacterium stylophorae TaxID=1776034 RepID=A0A8J7VTQ7_9GAMM|nr:response regulator transcription factor [Coralloluteibacterium stylophorae]MBS7457089.1 response regulator transcription factor [Coralloluteibacterium stylophorae]